jgi:signal transduction histidine kinase
MRAVSWVFAVLGGCALIVAVVANLVRGDPAGAGWILVGPTPLYAVGLAGAFRGRGHPVAVWLLAGGSLFMLNSCLGDIVQPHAGAAAGWVALAALCADTASQVVAIGLIGLFPTGRPDRVWQRVVLITAGGFALLVAVLALMSSPTSPRDPYAAPGTAPPGSPIFVPWARPAAAAANVAYQAFVAVALVGVIMLYLRYRRAPQAQRRQIRLALIGTASAMAVFAAQIVLAWTGGQGAGWAMLVVALWIIGLALVLGSLIVALSPEELLGINRSARRTAVHRGLRVLAAAGYVAIAATLGILASKYLPDGAAIAVSAGAALAFWPAQRRLERIADRWAFGARLDGYDVLSRFGALLQAAPAPDRLLGQLAEEICQALRLTWVTVRLDVDADGATALAGHAVAGPGGQRGHGEHAAPPEPDGPDLVVPLAHGGDVLGAIECGPRRDGPLLDEDRRLLTQLASQAAAAVSNLHLSAQLAGRLEVIERQATELAASRARVVLAQDAERRRIQRDLHDGFQQEVVALTAKLALARQWLRRDDKRAGQALGDLQADLGGLLAQLREFAHAIHPPVLADQGLLEAIEAQASKLPVEVIIDADPALRGRRFAQDVESAAWYVVAEALTNVVKHANARRVSVALAQPNGSLSVEVNDDGCGFDPAVARGLGLAGLADRMAIVNGELTVDSGAGRGTTLRAEVPLRRSDHAGDDPPHD